MSRHLLSLVIAAGCMLAMQAATNTCSAGILMPDQVTFDEKDLAAALASRDSGVTEPATATSSMSSAASNSAPIRRIERDWWSHELENENLPFELAKSKLPTGNTSSSTSSSSSVAGAPGSTVVCLLSTSLIQRDDSPLGQLAEDHGFALPDAPGTDLLRPPQV
jgi:hypothetical protein